MASGKGIERLVKGKALRLAALLVIIAGIFISLTFAVSFSNPPAGDSTAGEFTLYNLVDNPQGAGTVLLRHPDTGKETATASTLAGGQQAQIRWDDDTGVPAFLTGQITPPAGANAVQSTLAFFQENKDLFHMSSPEAELSLKRNESDSLGMTHLRLAQVYKGVPVFGSDLAVHFSHDGKIVAINGRYVPGINLSVDPDVTVEKAVEIAQADLGKPVAASSFEPPQLTVLTPGGRQALLAWKVTLAGDDPPLRMVYFVDAHRGEIAARYDNLEAAKNRMTYTAANGTTLPGTLIINEGGSSSDWVAQAAHNNIGLTYDYFLSTFGRDSFNGAGATLTSTVHYSTSYNNAFWNGYQMVYGDGDGRVFSPLAAGLDVVAHELTHGVTQYTADLVYSYQSGALNESYSDVFAAMVDRDDWLIGEDVYTPGTSGDALRSLSDPTLYGQPAHMSNYVYTDNDNGGVHINSGIPNKAAYNVATSIGKDKMEKIWYRALTVYLTSGSQFTDARDASVQAAADFFGIDSAEVVAVENGFAAVGIGAGQTSPTTARVEIDHTYRGDLVVTVGVGDPDSPIWSTMVSNRQGGSADNIYATVDIAAGASYLPPSWQNRWFLKVYDAAGQDIGAIKKFTITDNGTTYTATDVPIPIYDYQTSVTFIPTSDNTAPAVSSTSPAQGAMGVYNSSNIYATFSESVSPSTVNSTSFMLVKHSDGIQVSGAVSYDSKSNTAVFDPAVDLEPMTVYDATITTTVTDLAGNHLLQNYQWSFTTGPPAKPYYFTWYDMASPGMRDWLVMGNPSSSSNQAGFDVFVGNNKVNAGPLMTLPGQTQPVTYAGIMGGPVKVLSLGGSSQVVSKRTLYGDSFEEINALEESRLDSHYYFTWYDAKSPGAKDWVLIANPGETTVEADIYIAGRKMNASPYQIAAGSYTTPEFPGIMGGPVEIVAYEPGNPSVPRKVIASQRVIWSGNFNEVIGIPAAELSSDYLYTWYDMQSAGAINWVLVSNPNNREMVAEIWIGGQKMTNSATKDQYFKVPAGGIITPTFPGTLAGPVEIKGYEASTYDPAAPGSPNMNFYTTQRVLFGASFEEIAGFGVSRLAPVYHFSWYDQKSPGSTNWVLVANPGRSEAKAEVWIAGVKKTTLTIAPGASQTPTFPGIMNGPVEVRGYDSATYNPDNPGVPNHNIFVSQRVLWNGHFNEVEGIVL